MQVEYYVKYVLKQNMKPPKMRGAIQQHAVPYPSDRPTSSTELLGIDTTPTQ